MIWLGWKMILFTNKDKSKAKNYDNDYAKYMYGARFNSKIKKLYKTKSNRILDYP